MYPEYVEINNKRYKINTDFKVAIECSRISDDNTIGDIERGLAIIYLLFGDEGLDAKEDYEKLIELGKKYLLCGKEYDKKNNEKPDMDFVQDYEYIWTSMYSDYNGLDIDKEKIHWWKFMKLMNGLSYSEFGNCCILNRIRNLRNMDTKDIKDRKEKERIEKAKEQYALKKDKKRKQPTKEQINMANDLLEKIGIKKR